LAAVDLSPLYFEVNPNCAQIIGLEGVLTVANQETGFANPAVSNHQILESDVLLGAHYYFKV
jgi:hypothetical protein